MKKINSFIKKINFDENSSIFEFVIKIFEEVEKTKDINSFIPERIKFYNFLGGLDYLNVNYSLTLGKNCLNYHQAKEG